MCDVHRYWGWSYNSFLTYYNLRDKLPQAAILGDAVKNQPLTFTECVGSFTGWAGEFNLVRSKQLAPQLGWIGHATNRREDALAYQAFWVKQATESFRRMRPLNPRLAGIMPFTILFHNWSGITSFEQMKPKPAMEQLGLSYQPVLLSWELWTPQVYAGAEVRALAHVINDADNGTPLTNATLVYRSRRRVTAPFCQGTVKLPPIPYGTWRRVLQLELPSAFASGQYLISGGIVSGSRMLSTNAVDLFVASSEWQEQIRRAGAPIHLYDPSGRTVAAFQEVGLEFEPNLQPVGLAGADRGVGDRGGGHHQTAARTEAAAATLREGWRAHPLPAAGREGVRRRLAASSHHPP